MLPDIRAFANPVTQERFRPNSRNYLFKNLPEEQAGVALLYDVAPDDVVNLKISISFTNIGNARNNMFVDGSENDFDKVRAAARATWNDWLGRITVKGGPEETRVKFHTDLWQEAANHFVFTYGAGHVSYANQPCCSISRSPGSPKAEPSNSGSDANPTRHGEFHSTEILHLRVISPPGLEFPLSGSDDETGVAGHGRTGPQAVHLPVGLAIQPDSHSFHLTPLVHPSSFASPRR